MTSRATLAAALACILGGLMLAGGWEIAGDLARGWWHVALFPVVVGLLVVFIAFALVAGAHRDRNGRAYLTPWSERDER